MACDRFVMGERFRLEQSGLRGSTCCAGFSDRPTTTVTELPAWTHNLRECELIGDSYRGYVCSQEEIEVLLERYMQETGTAWGTRQSPSNKRPSHRLMWRSHYVWYDGIPFRNTGRRATVMECEFGPRRKGTPALKAKAVSPPPQRKRPHQSGDDEDESDEEKSQVKRWTSNSSGEYRLSCPARIYIKKITKFPAYRVDLRLEGRQARLAQEKALARMRRLGVDKLQGEVRWYVQLPTARAHEFHSVASCRSSDESLDQATGHDHELLGVALTDSQRLDRRVQRKIRELVASGIIDVLVVKHKLADYVQNELFAGKDKPNKHNRSFYPTIIDIQNHTHAAAEAIRTGALVPLFSPQDEQMVAVSYPIPHSMPPNVTFNTFTNIPNVIQDHSAAALSQLRKRRWQSAQQQGQLSPLSYNPALSALYDQPIMSYSPIPRQSLPTPGSSIISPSFLNTSSFNFATLDVLGAAGHQLRQRINSQEDKEAAVAAAAAAALEVAAEEATASPTISPPPLTPLINNFTSFDPMSRWSPSPLASTAFPWPPSLYLCEA